MQVLKDTVAIFVGFVILFALAIVADVPLERLADPTDTSYIPRPEWYFLFLFQTLKFFQGPLETVGSVVLPGLAVVSLFLIPFIDRGPMVRVAKRTFAITFVALAALAWTGLTAAAIRSTPNTGESARNAGPAAEAWQQLTPPELAGLAYFRSENCIGCHPGGGKKGIGPELTKMSAAHRTPSWMIPHFKRPAQVVPGSSMPPVQLGDAQLNMLAAFLLKLTPDDEAALMSTPAFAVQGALVYQSSNCAACHQVNNVGMKVGPPLDGEGVKRDRDWLEKHFRDPQSMSPGSAMPAYKFTDKDMDAICRYLLSL